jgi:hypothetical protein
MKKTFNKSEAIKKAVETYKNDENLNMRAAARIHGCDSKLISNHFKGKIKSISDYFVIYQKFSPIEENMLARYIIRTYNSEFSLIIQYFNDCTNELL